MSSMRIDVHQHVIPGFWAEWLKSKGGDPSGWAAPEWSAQAAIEMMDSMQISLGMLSVTAPGVSVGAGREVVDMARRINDWVAELVGGRPDRFGLFATLPMPDVDATLEEIRYALDVLGADGVTLFTNYDNCYLGDPKFEPVFEELDRRAAFVFVHPSKPVAQMVRGIPSPVMDYPLDTTRTATSMVYAGTMHRFKHMKVSLSHAGGVLPFLAHRIAELGAAAVVPEYTREQILEGMRSFYFDTALSSSPTGLPSLLALADPERVLFGSDFPYAPQRSVAYFTEGVDAYPRFAADQLAKINRLNALKLFPRLSRHSATGPRAGANLS